MLTKGIFYIILLALMQQVATANMAAQLSWLERSVHTRQVIGSNPIAATITWPHRQAVKTSPFHGEVSGSNPLGVTRQQKRISLLLFYCLFFIILMLKRCKFKFEEIKKEHTLNKKDIDLFANNLAVSFLNPFFWIYDKL